ncbi:MAG: hypothetical protein KAJ75_02755, partial [Alphaproteobacteria bacterium]|nr:hypothetical protein [Alphaproteobacteria bacterium]
KGIKHFLIGSKIIVDVVKISKPVLSIDAESPKSAPVSAVEPEPLKVEEVEKLPEEKPVEPKKEIKKPVKDLKKRIVSLSIPWEQSVASAVFKRDNYLWIVFDRLKQVDIKLMKKVGGNILADVIQVPHGSATVLRLVTKAGYNPSLRREGLLWIIDLIHQPFKPKITVDVIPQLRTEIGPKLFFPVSEASSVISIVDPAVGDNMLIIPFVSLGRGIFPKHEYPDAELPITIQGIAVFAKNPNLKARTSRIGVELLSEDNGLKLSSDTENMAALLNLGEIDSKNGLFCVGKWEHGGQEYYNDNYNKLIKTITNISEEKKNKARLELARFYVANGYEAEALGVLRTIAIDSPKMTKEPSFLATRGISNFLMHRYKEAVSDFSNKEFINNDEAIFWKAATKASIKEPEKQGETLRNKSATIRMYPLWLRTKLAIVGAMATLAIEDDWGAQNFLEVAENEKNSTYDKVALAYYRGVWNEISGAFKPALKEYKIAEESKNRKYRALAAKARIKLELSTSLIEPIEAAKQLERLRFVWRGDKFEYDLLNMLSDMHVAAGNYGDGLRMMRHVSSNFRNYPNAEKIPERMREIFDNLFLEGKADKLSPVVAIGLYDEFRELSPSGEKGDEVIRRLADRLVSVDLLGRASELLERQVSFRLSGEKKAKIGARLALVCLLNRKPKAAIDALEKSKINNMNEKLVIQRKHLMARALSDSGNHDNAIKILESDKTERGTLLKAEIYWQNKKWSEAADVIESLVKKPAKGEKIKPKQALLVIDWAIALRLAGRGRAAMRLRYNFMKYIKETKHYNTFNLLTSGDEGVPIDYRTIGDQIKEAETFTTFMSSYIERLKKDGLSKIN